MQVQEQGGIGGIAASSAGHEYGTASRDSQHLPQALGFFRSVQYQQGALAAQRPPGRLGWGGQRVFAKGARQLLQGHRRVRLSVEAMEDDAMGEARRRAVTGRE